MMNDKVGISDLMAMLAERHGMSDEDAERFVKEFFLLIEESLEKDKYVKIKGLGTFKLIEVGSRESINVNTGERFEIQGHTKISFVPEPTLKEVINRPFSHFETVVLNENTILEDTPLESDSEEEEPTTLSKAEDANGEMIQTEEVKPQEPVTVPASSKASEADVPPQAPASSSTHLQEKRDGSAMKYFIAAVLFVILLCGGTVAFVYNPDLMNLFTTDRTQGDPNPIQDIGLSDKPLSVAVDTLCISTDSILKDTVPVQNKTQDLSVSLKAEPKQPQEQKPVQKKKQASSAPVKPDSVNYTIVGTETTYTIKEGETLTKVALRFYGTKALWPYIVKHNPDVIKNPDNVPYGTTIKIPKLVKAQ